MMSNPRHTLKGKSVNSASARIVRAMGVFSGVRIVGILCSLVRNKLIASLIGPAGMGLVILYNSIVDLIAQTTRLSFDQSAQRDISQASAAAAATTIAVVRRWTVWLGLSGSVIMCALSPLLSWWTFDTMGRWPVFCLLAVVPFCLTYNASVLAQNQGLKRFKALASSSLAGAFAGLAAAVPLIIWLRIDSIAWVIVAYGLSSWLGAYLFRPRVERVHLDRQEIISRGGSFLKLGAQITLAWFAAQLCAYLFVLYLNAYASTDVLGIYQSGFTLMNSYIGIVFTALFVEYYPRLSAIAHSPRRLALAASHEARLTLMLLTPALCLLVILAAPVIRLIYSSDFLPVIPYIVISCSGVVFRVLSWCLAYVILARGDGRAYLKIEILSSVVGLAANIVGYNLGEFMGLGIAYTLWYAIYTVLVAVVCRRYGVSYDARTRAYGVAAFAMVTTTALLYLHFAL